MMDAMHQIGTGTGSTNVFTEGKWTFNMEDEKAVSFVTKKALLSLLYPITFMLDGTAISAHAVVIEYQQAENGRGSGEPPCSFLIIGLPDGRKLKKAYGATISYGSMRAIVELGPEDWAG